MNKMADMVFNFSQSLAEFSTNFAQVYLIEFFEFSPLLQNISKRVLLTKVFSPVSNCWYYVNVGLNILEKNLKIGGVIERG